MSEAGSQQLLLDTQAIKALLLDFPSAGVLPLSACICMTELAGSQVCMRSDQPTWIQPTR